MKFAQITLFSLMVISCGVAQADRTTRNMSSDAQLVADLLVGSSLDGSAAVEGCVARFKKLNHYADRSTINTGNTDEESESTIVEISGPRKQEQGTGRVTLQLLHGEGSLECKVLNR